MITFKSRHAETGIPTSFVHTQPAILARRAGAIIRVGLTMLADESIGALAGVLADFIDTDAAV